jgi:N-acetylglucosamine-6-phosphate deacetylase
MTHFGNAMAPLHHRAVGPIGWGLLHDDVTVDVIADLHHLSADMLRLVFKAKGGAGVALISDAIPPAGLPDGPYRVWGETLTVKDGVVRNATGNLAGSVCLLDECLARLVSAGIPEDTALRAASEVPARVLSRT